MDWEFEDVSVGEFLYEIGLRSGDKNAEIWAFDPVSGNPLTSVFELDTLDGMFEALNTLSSYPDIAVRVERGKTAYGYHTIEISQVDCGVDRDGDGVNDSVRCQNP